MADSPRCWPASRGTLGAVGLGLIMQDIGDEQHALDAYRKAVDVYPRLKEWTRRSRP